MVVFELPLEQLWAIGFSKLTSMKFWLSHKARDGLVLVLSSRFCKIPLLYVAAWKEVFFFQGGFSTHISRFHILFSLLSHIDNGAEWVVLSLSLSVFHEHGSCISFSLVCLSSKCLFFPPGCFTLPKYCTNIIMTHIFLLTNQDLLHTSVFSEGH